MGLYLLTYTIIVPVVAQGAEHAKRVAERHLLDEAEGAEVDVEEITSAIPAGYQDVTPWGDDSEATIQQRLGVSDVGQEV